MRLTLKGKLAMGGLFIALVTLVISGIVTALIIRHQNRNQASATLKRAFLLVQDHFKTIQSQITNHMIQIASRSELADLVKFFEDAKGSQDASTAVEGQLLEMTKNLLEDLRVGHLSKIALYDSQGELLGFAALNHGNALLGFAFTSDKGRGFKTVSGELPKAGAVGLKDFRFTLHQPIIPEKYGHTVPHQIQTKFGAMGKAMTFEVIVPIWAKDYVSNGDSVKEIKKIVGVVACSRPIDRSVLNRLSYLTGMQVNLFKKDQLSQGTIVNYSRLDSHIADLLKGKRQSSLFTGLRPVIRDMSLGNKQYLEGICPLFNGPSWAGAISILYPTEIFKKNTYQMIKALSIVSLICILLILPLTLFFGRSVANPVSKIAAALDEASTQVFTASSQVSDASQSLAEGASKQAASLEETSTSLEEITNMTKRNAINAKEAENLTESITSSLSKANVSMKALISSLEDISKTSANVSEVVRTISDIAFQTNLLALNAAVEAARAGEAGSGFAVVADEVRNLAMRSSQASNNTHELLEGIVQKIEKGSDLVKETDDRYREVAIKAKEARGLMENISRSSEEQSMGVTRIAEEIHKMNAIVQETAAQAEQTASASEQMKTQAAQLDTIIEKIVSIVGKISTKSQSSRD